MTRAHQLERTLRTLKLGGMLDTLQARLAQARAGELGHLEFLQVLCEDELARRHAKALRERVRRARFQQPATLEDFDFHASPKLPAAQIRDLAALRWLHVDAQVPGPAGGELLSADEALPQPAVDGHLAHPSSRSAGPTPTTTASS